MLPEAPPRPSSRLRQFRHRDALRGHERYLVALLAGYDGPNRRAWEEELAGVRRQLALLGDGAGR